jgi:hypothetical protein
MDPMSQLLMFAFVAVGLVGCSLANNRLAERRTHGGVMTRPGTSRLGSDHTALGARMAVARTPRYPESAGGPR